MLVRLEVRTEELHDDIDVAVAQQRAVDLARSRLWYGRGLLNHRPLRQRLPLISPARALRLEGTCPVR
jgi:hypothetical protein